MGDHVVVLVNTQVQFIVVYKVILDVSLEYLEIFRLLITLAAHWTGAVHCCCCHCTIRGCGRAIIAHITSVH